MVGAGIKGYHVLLTSDRKSRMMMKTKRKKNKKKGHKVLNFKDYNKLILVQEDISVFISIKKKIKNPRNTETQD